MFLNPLNFLYNKKVKKITKHFRNILRLFSLSSILGEYFVNRCDPTDQSCIPCPNRLPSCKNLPDGQQVIKNLYDNLQYLAQCRDNRTLSYRVCTPGSLDCVGVPMATTAPPYRFTTPMPTTPPPTQPLGM